MLHDRFAGQKTKNIQSGAAATKQKQSKAEKRTSQKYSDYFNNAGKF